MHSQFRRINTVYCCGVWSKLTALLLNNAHYRLTWLREDVHSINKNVNLDQTCIKKKRLKTNKTLLSFDKSYRKRWCNRFDTSICDTLLTWTSYLTGVNRSPVPVPRLRFRFHDTPSRHVGRYTTPSPIFLQKFAGGSFGRWLQFRYLFFLRPKAYKIWSCLMSV